MDRTVRGRLVLRQHAVHRYAAAPRCGCRRSAGRRTRRTQHRRNASAIRFRGFARAVRICPCHSFAAGCSLTGRSTGASTAGHRARDPLAVYAAPRGRGVQPSTHGKPCVVRPQMNPTEALALSYLKSVTLGEVVHEPDGNIPPDFPVDGRVAVEVRRLNQNSSSLSADRPQALEELAIPTPDASTRAVVTCTAKRAAGRPEVTRRLLPLPICAPPHTRPTRSAPLARGVASPGRSTLTP